MAATIHLSWHFHFFNPLWSALSSPGLPATWFPLHKSFLVSCLLGKLFFLSRLHLKLFLCHRSTLCPLKIYTSTTQYPRSRILFPLLFVLTSLLQAVDVSQMRWLNEKTQGWGYKTPGKKIPLNLNLSSCCLYIGTDLSIQLPQNGPLCSLTLTL